MPGGSRIPIEKWPTKKLVGVGITIAFIVGSGLFLTGRACWKAWSEGERMLALTAATITGFFGVWIVVLVQFGRELLRRWHSGRVDFSAPLPDNTAVERTDDKKQKGAIG